MANTGNRMQWFEEARFGMFIHWGLYAIPARGEWVRSMERIPVEDYRLYFEEFDPVDYAPAKWARLAKATGMKYAVLTAILTICITKLRSWLQAMASWIFFGLIFLMTICPEKLGGQAN